MSVTRALRLVAGSASIAAQFAPVPGLQPAVSIFISMLEICDKVRFNKRQIRELCDRCEKLLFAVRDSAEGSEPARVDAMVQKSITLLESIKLQMTNWSNAGLVKQVLAMPDLSEDIRRCNQDIDKFLETFNITMHMEVQHWMTRIDENLKSDQADTVLYLSNIQNNTEIIMGTLAAQQADLKELMGALQTTLAVFPKGDANRAGISYNLLSVQESSGLLLPDPELKNGEAEIVSKFPIDGNGAFDIYEGLYLKGRKCTIKMIRSLRNSPTLSKRFINEVTVWRIIYNIDKGKHILPFWGACLNDEHLNHPFTVYPWMQYGNLTNYLKLFPDANRMTIAYQIAEGLKVLHGHTTPIAHGDLRPTNIYINDLGEPLLADFSFSQIMEDLTSTPFTESSGIPDVFRWCAPELVTTSSARRAAPPADMYAFGMTLLELMTGAVPYAEIRRSPLVLQKLLNKERPRRPEGEIYVQRGLTDEVWALMQRCWAEDPLLRPTVDEVLVVLPKQ